MVLRAHADRRDGCRQLRAKISKSGGLDEGQSKHAIMCVVAGAWPMDGGRKAGAGTSVTAADRSLAHSTARANSHSRRPSFTAMSP